MLSIVYHIKLFLNRCSIYANLPHGGVSRSDYIRFSRSTKWGIGFTSEAGARIHLQSGLSDLRRAARALRTYDALPGKYTRPSRVSKAASTLPGTFVLTSRAVA